MNVPILQISFSKVHRKTPNKISLKIEELCNSLYGKMASKGAKASGSWFFQLDLLPNFKIIFIYQHFGGPNKGPLYVYFAHGCINPMFI